MTVSHPLPCRPKCNCERRRLLNDLKLTDVADDISTVKILQGKLRPVLGGPTHVFALDRIESLGDHDTRIFQDVLDQSLDSGNAHTRHSVPCKRLMKTLARRSTQFPSSFYLDGIQRNGQPILKLPHSDIFDGRLNRQKVALKLLRPASPEGLPETLYREAVLWRYLNHENVLPFLGIDKSFLPDFCLVSPYMEHGTIKQYVAKHTPSDNRILSFILQITEGLNYLHSNGIVHADIKPDNIFIDKNERAKVGDMGLAFLSDNQASLALAFASASRDSASGTTRYMAPELITPKHTSYSHKSTKETDVFALGMTMYEILTGSAPFAKSKAESIMFMIADGCRPSQDVKTRNGRTINQREWKLIFQCLEYQPGLRPSFPDILRELRSFQANDLPGQSQTPGWGPFRWHLKQDSYTNRGQVISPPSLITPGDPYPRPQSARGVVKSSPSQHPYPGHIPYPNPSSSLDVLDDRVRKPPWGPRVFLKPRRSVSRAPNLETNPNSGHQQSSVTSLSPQPSRPPSPPLPSTPPLSLGKKDEARKSRPGEMDDLTWAPRPPPEDVYERLEEFFLSFDLDTSDTPPIGATSGGTSQLNRPPPPPDSSSRVRGKKSIRIMAERNRAYRASHPYFPDPFTMIPTSVNHKSIKPRDIRFGEVTPQAKGLASSQSDLPSAADPKLNFKWVRGELIGEGTYARVYLALNATTGEMIAVKQLEIPSTAGGKNDEFHISAVRALKTESETLKDLDHPNIIQYLGFEETTSYFAIFMEYVTRGSLSSCLLEYGEFEGNVTKLFTTQILRGVGYLHSRGVLHGNLKADNILVEGTGKCRISGFGNSKRMEDMNGGGDFTPRRDAIFYMAPEVINQRKGCSSKIDIWSVGCVVQEMWTGQQPWKDEVTSTAVRFQLYESKLPPVPSNVVLSSLADDLRRKCFAINPGDRPSAADLQKHPYLTLPEGWQFLGFN